jgi:hypothetical protein
LLTIYRDLSSNRISVIEDNAFNNLPNLEDLWVLFSIIYKLSVLTYAIRIANYYVIWSCFNKMYSYSCTEKKYTTHYNYCSYLKIRCFKAGSNNKLMQSLSVTFYLYVWLKLGLCIFFCTGIWIHFIETTPNYVIVCYANCISQNRKLQI